MNIDDVSRNWTELGENDPMWVVLTDSEKRHNGWTVEEFFATGKAEVSELFDRLPVEVLPLSGPAMDFGCGVGRLTQALADRFEFVDGVDISASMIRHAEKLNRFPDRVKYHLNVCPDLSRFLAQHYGFIFSIIALQHTPSRFQCEYIRDYLRLLKPGGIAVFQTIHARGWRQFVPEWGADLIRKCRSKGRAFIPLYGLPVSRVLRILNRPGITIVNYETVGYPRWESRYSSDLFIVKKADH